MICLLCNVWLGIQCRDPERERDGYRDPWCYGRGARGSIILHQWMHKSEMVIGEQSYELVNDLLT
jgi:hypothetical protein